MSKDPTMCCFHLELTYYLDVKDWHRRFQLEAPDSPLAEIPAQLMQHRVDLIEEEYQEFLHAIKVDDREEILDGLADLVFVAIGTAVSLGYDFDEAWYRVVASNYSKLDAEGKPIIEPNGKVGKGPGFFPPDLSDLVVPRSQHEV